MWFLRRHRLVNLLCSDSTSPDGRANRPFRGAGIRAIREKTFALRLAIQAASILCLMATFAPAGRSANSGAPLFPISSISGNVHDQNGDMIAGAKVILNPLPNGERISMYTDSKGSFAFLGLSAGNYRILAQHSGFLEVSQEVHLTEGESQELKLSLKPKNLHYDMVIVGEGATEQAEINGLGRLSDVQGTAIYAGKKNDLLILGSLNANLAAGNTRQVFAKIPGTNIWENDGSGLQIGISNRGLDPNRSWEMHSRQNGYDITADIFGYPEAYFTPPLEAVDRIEVVRGASSLQYGAQFGGLVNYVLKGAPEDRRFSFSTEQTAGANSLFNSHNRIGGTLGRLTYNGYYHHRQANGWRPNSGFEANTGFGSLNYRNGKNLAVGFELTRMKYLLQMAGGLTDELFEQNPRVSLRPRNWFSLEWLVPSIKIDYRISTNTRLGINAFGLRGTRYSLFNSEPVTDSNGELNFDDPAEPRTLYIDRFRNHGIEMRLLQDYSFLDKRSTLAAGFRYSNGKTVRQHGWGFPGFEPNFSLFEPDVYRNLHFRNVNFAGFLENIFRVTDKLRIVPGFRYDHINSLATGKPIAGTREQSRSIPLFGLGANYQVGEGAGLYANISQAYRATLFNDQWRPDPVIIVDSNLKDMTGYVAEFGLRGSRGRWIHYDIGGFYLKYRNRLGLLTRQGLPGQSVSLWTNVSDSRNIGLESFVEVDLLRMLRAGKMEGGLSFFSSFAYTDTRYLGGDLRGNRVELAPKSIARFGVTYRLPRFSTTLQHSRTGDQFTDANNTMRTINGVFGKIPAYQVWDLSGSYYFRKYYVLRAGSNNLANASYFTRRATSYPGPGLIPADGRSFYASIGINF